MDNFLGNFLIEIGVFCFFGLIYYFYQKRKITHYEANKKPIIMEMILQSCLTDKTSEAQPELDSLIEALDDFLQNKSSLPPLTLLETFSDSQSCSSELREVIKAGLKELDEKE